MYSGIHAVLYGLFDRDEKIDPDAMASQVEFCVGTGCHGINILGLATEVQKLTPTERAQLITIVSHTLRGRLPLSVTISGNSVAEQVALIRVAEDQRANWLVLQPPSAGNYDADVYLDFFRRVGEQTELPVAIQNAPAFLGRSLSGEDISRLKLVCPNLTAVKSEDAVEGIEKVIAAAGDDLHVLGGQGGRDMISLMQLGCSGFVLAPDIAPIAVRIYDTWSSGDTHAALELFNRAQPAIEFTMESLEHLICYGKRIFAKAAGLQVFDRSPSIPLNEDKLKQASAFSFELTQYAEDNRA